jgi:hypothetical protein
VLKSSLGFLLAGITITFSPLAAAGAAPPSDQLLPETTRAFVSVPDVDALIENWDQTQVGQLLDDERMKPFTKDLRRQLEEKWLRSHARLGLSLDDLIDLASGELALAVLLPPKGAASMVVLADVADKEQAATETIKKVSATLLKQGAKRTERKAHGVTLTVFESPPKRGESEVSHVIYFMHDGLFAASDRLDVATDLAARLAKLANKSKLTNLAGLEAYRAVMKRSDQAQPQLQPHLRWFIDPIGLAEAARTWQQHRKGDTDYLKVAKNQGFTAIRGAGGQVNFNAGKYGLLHRTFVFAPQPYRLAMRMLSFPNGDEFQPQPWVSREVSSYASFFIDPLNAFDKFESLFDELYGDEGIWKDTLKSIEEDPNGPGINLRRDLVAHLGQRATVITDYELPITPASQRKLLAIEAKNAKKLVAAIEKQMIGDPNATKRKVGDYDVWEVVPEEEAEIELDISEGDGEEGAAPGGGMARPGVLTRSAVTVADGYLLVSSHVSMLEKVLTKVATHEQLNADADYKLVQAEFANLHADKCAARGFSRTDEQLRVSYELFRQGKMPEADTFLGHFLNVLLGEEQEGVTRKARLDGGKLPDFKVVEHYLGPAGSFAVSEQDGWFLQGFTLGKQGPLAKGARRESRSRQ